MATIGELIGQFAEFLYGLWPLRVVSDWEVGARVRAGNVVAGLDSSTGLFGTGVHFFWPLIEEVYCHEGNVDTIVTPQQAHETGDHVSVAFNFAVRYAIVDLEAMYGTIHEPGTTIVNEILGSAGGLISTFTYEDAQSQLCDAVERDLIERLEEWGIELQSIRLANFAKANAVRLITGG